MSGPRPRVAVLGGGMAGLAAAWRLSEPGWRERFDRITVYQRGWRLGGKGASSRGPHGRIEEHGLHVWLGFYENAFRLVRECYAELDRRSTDPGAPILDWRDAFEPARSVGVSHGGGDQWWHWLARFAPNDQEPGDPGAPPRTAGPAEFARRGLQLMLDVVSSLAGEAPGGVVLSSSSDPPPAPPAPAVAIGMAVPAVTLEALRLAGVALERSAARADGRSAAAWFAPVVDALDRAQHELREAVDGEAQLAGAWQIVSLTVALVRGVVADGVLTEPDAIARLDDEDYLAWIRRHGAAPEAVDGGFLRGLYDLVFGYEDGDRARPRFGAGTGLLLAMKLALEYRGAVFWRMRAGMGDVVFAPLYQALRRRGVDFELFSRIDRLQVSGDRRAIEAVALGRQALPAAGVDRYEPLLRVRGLPCFPPVPLVGQLAGLGAGVPFGGRPHEALECHGSGWPDAERVVLRRGADFDVAVLAVPPPMAAVVGAELVADRPEWRAMVAGIRTTATHALQLWLREPEPALGWPWPGAALSGLGAPFDTWASMTQLLAVEDWPAGDRPRAIAYLCGVLPGAWPPVAGMAGAAAAHTRAEALRFLERDVRHLLPGAMDGHGFRWDLLCGSAGRTGAAALDSQFWTANVDLSDRYVLSVPGSGRHRLRPDESGYDNLVLAGDWTDSGLNAGCIEAAVLSGLQAANALLGRDRHHRVVGYLQG